MIDIPIVDSRMHPRLAIQCGLPDACPREIIERQCVVQVSYYSFDGLLHSGQIVLDARLAFDIGEIFALIRKLYFPVESVIPLSDERFLEDGNWSDARTMRKNNTSAFNYRTIAGTARLSNHALGTAIDINPRQNPFITDTTRQPEDATYDPDAPGTLSADHPVVMKFKSLGWQWGGDWSDPIDYQHFEKVL